MNPTPKHEGELRRAREAAEDEIRRLIARYEATGRDYGTPERVALEHALARHDKGVTHREHVWSYSRPQASLVRARVMPRAYHRPSSVPAGTRAYHHAYYEDLSERNGLEIETTTGGGRV